MTVWQERDNYIKQLHPTVDWGRYRIMWGIDDEGQPVAYAVPTSMSPRDGFEIDPDSTYRASRYVPELRSLVRRSGSNEDQNLRMPPALDSRHWTRHFVDDLRLVEITQTVDAAETQEFFHRDRPDFDGSEAVAYHWAPAAGPVDSLTPVFAVDPVRPVAE